MEYFAKFLVILLVASISAGQGQPEVGNYFQGDIIGISTSLQFRPKSGLIREYYRWPNAIVPYEFEPGYPTELQSQFRLAAQHIATRTCLRFVVRTNQPDYLRIVNRSGCSSYVGRIGGPQNVHLSQGCSYGNFIHEIIHALGFFHEQARPDRDNHVKINYENIQPGTEHNFNKQSADVVTDFGIAYDFHSIMHYGATFFSKNHQPTITTIPEGISIGQRSGMSASDTHKIKIMYKCPY